MKGTTFTSLRRDNERRGYRETREYPENSEMRYFIRVQPSEASSRDDLDTRVGATGHVTLVHALRIPRVA